MPFALVIFFFSSKVSVCFFDDNFYFFAGAFYLFICFKYVLIAGLSIFFCNEFFKIIA